MSIRDYAYTLIDFQAFLDFVCIITESHSIKYQKNEKNDPM